MCCLFLLSSHFWTCWIIPTKFAEDMEEEASLAKKIHIHEHFVKISSWIVGRKILKCITEWKTAFLFDWGVNYSICIYWLASCNNKWYPTAKINTGFDVRTKDIRVFTLFDYLTCSPPASSFRSPNLLSLQEGLCWCRMAVQKVTLVPSELPPAASSFGNIVKFYFCFISCC